jgi:hypothetical protein
MTWDSGDVSCSFLERPVGGYMPPPPYSIQFTYCYMLQGLPFKKRRGSYLIKVMTVQALCYAKRTHTQPIG